MMASTLDLPAPFAPIRATVSPSFTLKLTSSCRSAKAACRVKLTA
jgi:hypothetical protein